MPPNLKQQFNKKVIGVKNIEQQEDSVKYSESLSKWGSESYGVDRRCGVAEVRGVTELLGSAELGGVAELGKVRSHGIRVGFRT